MDTNKIRAEQIAGMRRMADWLEAHPTVPLHYGITTTVYVGSLDEARALRMASVGGWRKTVSDYAFTYEQVFTGDEVPAWQSCRYSLNVGKSEDTCTRVQVGTRHVEAVPAVEAHEEPVFEWQCYPTADTDAIAE
jgi:hypothetical protein